MRNATVEYTGEDFSFLMATNFESAYNLCQLAHPLLKASGAASIILMSSVCGVVSVVDGGSIYGATKGNSWQHFLNIILWALVLSLNPVTGRVYYHFSLILNLNLISLAPTSYMLIIGAMSHLARILACEWARDNIRTNSVTPWFVPDSSNWICKNYFIHWFSLLHICMQFLFMIEKLFLPLRKMT